MRILVLTDSFLPHGGGSRVYYYNIYKEWAAAYDDDITILTRKIPGYEHFDATHSHGFRIVRHQTPLQNWKWHNLPKAAFPFLDAIRMVRHNQIDLIHAGDLFPPGIIALSLKRLVRIPYLIYCHGEEVVKTDRYRVQPKLRDKIYKAGASVIAANEFARTNLLRVGISGEHIYKILPGVDCERFSPKAQSSELIRRFGLQGKTVLLTVARLQARKGHDVVLQALAKVRCQFDGVHYLVVGMGPEENRLRQLAEELGLSSMVTFVGFVPEEQLPDFYNLADVFIMTNREESDGDVEGFGMVFLEANATGKPVVGGLSGGAGEAIVHGITGFQVQPTDVGEITRVLLDLLQNPELRRKLGDAGLIRARTHFSWRQRAKMLHEVSAHVLHGGSSTAYERMLGARMRT